MPRPPASAHIPCHDRRRRALAAAGVLLTLPLWSVGTPAFAETGAPSLAAAQTMLQAADRFRLSSDNLQVDTQVQLYDKEGRLDKERHYTVLLRDPQHTLVLMTSPAERGQKVLMEGDDFWLLMPNSQRPMRITPAQKLLGEASTGDIATLSWSQDYAVTATALDTCALKHPQPQDGGSLGPCVHLSLRASRSALSYQRIELWLGAKYFEPLQAHLYVHSEKLAKQARFECDSATPPTQVTAMVLEDHLGGHQQTVVRYVSRRARNMPDAWLNPMFLARNPVLE